MSVGALDPLDRTIHDAISRLHDAVRGAQTVREAEALQTRIKSIHARVEALYEVSAAKSERLQGGLSAALLNELHKQEGQAV